MGSKVNVNRLGVISKQKILQELSDYYLQPIENETDLINFYENTGVNFTKDKYKKVNKLWRELGGWYNNRLDIKREEEERKKEALRKKRIKEDNDYLNSVISFIQTGTTLNQGSMKTFKIPRDDLMLRVISELAKSNKKIVMRIGRNYYTLNPAFLMKVRDNILNEDFMVEEQEEYVSDEMATIGILNNTTFTLKIIDDNLSNKKKGGEFFKWLHKIDKLDLDDYQISTDFKQYDEACFIHSVRLYYQRKGIDKEAEIQDIKCKMTSRKLTLQKVKYVAEILKVGIKVKDIRSKTQKNHNNNIIHYKNTDNDDITDIIELGLIDDHYFLIEDLEITKYALMNYDKIKNIDRWNEIYKKRDNYYCRDRKRFINSFDVIKIMYENSDKYLTELTPDQKMETHHFKVNKPNDIKPYELNPKSTQKVCYEPKEEKFPTMNIYFDFETTTDGVKHEPYLLCYTSQSDDKVKVINEGKRTPKKFLEEICKDAKKKGYESLRCIAHNVNYDFQFLYPFISEINIIQRGTKLLCASGVYYHYGKKFYLKFVDSYSFIATKLCKFPKMFKLPYEKEIMPYSLWNKETIKENVITIKECRKYCDKQVDSMNIGKKIRLSDYENYYNEFIQKATEWDCLIGDENTDDEVLFDLYKYSTNYCKIDVKLLKDGYNIFRDWILEVCELDINLYITLPSLANDYMLKEGVYDGCYMVCGSQLQFIMKSMVGGRTMTRKNEKYYKDVELDDLDAVSLYPSAMNRLAGYLMGKPKVLKNLTYEFLKSVDGYYVDIRIKKVNKKYSFPLMSKINDEGIREWSNYMEGEILSVDKTQLEDLIEFHKIEFDVIQGYYYDEGRNYKIKEVINHLFDTRLKKKKEKMPDGSIGNPIEQIYKLLMNSAYGKTLLKPFDTDKEYIKEHKLDKFLIRHYDSVTNCVELHDKSYEVSLLKPIIEHYNLVHIGVEVLSMSKRIMNEVMCLAEDNNINIYYQDTDSTHTEIKDITDLNDAFKKKYERDLLGDKMGQFNCDFESDILKGDIKSVESIFLGKKCYIDKLQGEEEGVYDYHIRMKGVSYESIMDKCDELDIGVMELYKRLYDGETIEFDLACRGKKACFETIKDGTMITKKDFPRSVCFA